MGLGVVGSSATPARTTAHDMLGSRWWARGPRQGGHAHTDQAEKERPSGITACRGLLLSPWCVRHSGPVRIRSG